ncbi:MAG: Do family serine endopeptidase [Spirochaetales bacterium]
MKRKLVRNGLVPFLILVLASLFSCSPSSSQSAEAQPQRQTSSQSVAQQVPSLTKEEMGTLENYQNSLRKVAQKVLPVVVEIDVVEVVKQPVPVFDFFGNPFEFFFGPQDRNDRTPRTQPQEREFRKQGLGSGVIVRKDGKTVYVLTNNHVAGNASEIKVTLYDGRQFDAKLVGTDARKDLALVSFETSEDVPVAELGDSDQVQVGDFAVAVGNPLGFESTVTFGIVSAVGRKPKPGMDIGSFTDYIQTDAAINPGNSGGALANIYGQVIGINTWIASQSGGSIGLGFAIPINNAKKVIDDIITKGSVEYGWLGVNTGDPSRDLRESLGIKTTDGAFVFDVFLGSPADKAGIQPGDLIIQVGNSEVKDSNDLVRLVGNLSPGDVAKFQVIRFGETRTMTVRMEARKPESELQKISRKAWPGFSAVELTEQIRKNLGLGAEAGKVIVGNVTSGSPADSAGLHTGDIIREINGKKINTVADFYRAINMNGKEYMIRINRSGNDFLIGLVKER